MASATPKNEISKSVLIETALVDRLRTGDWHPGGRLPSENELAGQYGVCRSTIKKVLSTLSTKGLLESRQGKGHFVRGAPPRKITNTIGVTMHVDHHFDHPVNVKKMAGLQKALARSSYHFKVIFDYVSNGEPMRWTPKHVPHPEHVDTTSFDALWTNRHMWTEDGLRRLATELPVCCTDWYEEGHRLSRIEHDFLGGFTQAVARLAELGHGDFGLIDVAEDGRMASIFHDSIRLLDMTRPMEQARRRRILPIENYTEEDGRLCGRAFFARPRETWPTAVFAPDEVLCGFLSVAVERGVRIPADLSVVAVNNLLSGPVAGVRLSSLGLDYHREGELAGEEMLRMLADPSAPGRRLQLPITWNENESTGPARAASVYERAALAECGAVLHA